MYFLVRKQTVLWVRPTSPPCNYDSQLWTWLIYSSKHKLNLFIRWLYFTTKSNVSCYFGPVISLFLPHLIFKFCLKTKFTFNFLDTNVKPSNKTTTNHGIIMMLFNMLYEDIEKTNCIIFAIALAVVVAYSLLRFSDNNYRWDLEFVYYKESLFCIWVRI